MRTLKPVFANAANAARIATAVAAAPAIAKAKSAKVLRR
jgi:hypothetical protein